MPQKIIKIAAKKGDNKAFKGVDNKWYNVRDFVIPYLENVNKGDVVSITTEKKGAAIYVTKLQKIDDNNVEQDVPRCSICGKELKNPNYPTCWSCKDKAPKKSATENEKKSVVSYNNVDRTAQIQRGNALNAAAAVTGGQTFLNPETGHPDPDAAQQFTLILAEAFVDWLRIE